VRDAAQRLKMWDRKMRGDVYAMILAAVKDIALEKMQYYQVVHEYLIDLVKRIVGRYGIEPHLVHEYMWYAQHLWYLTQRYRSQALQIEADACFLFYYYRGRNEQVLRDIAAALGIKISSWDVLLGRLGMSAEMVYSGTKKALQETLHGVEVNPTDTQITYDPSTGLPTEILVTDRITGKAKRITIEYDAAGNPVRIIEEWV